ncbi:hypothetical protein BIY24_10340 [Halobacteriovorax marinus]|uniref:DnaK suppressor family protein n=1 Tax=Halobacteriovorax marinus (strain ATCC BAA-682 / DSM 15412 / SJ) TaxID=862908 RepID=E1X3T4_HALMS|nr:TraR/DksA family transcriptional regulator [Halobacteriovorax marinus]ATH08331.1 hypothetical protein BIY24_10340 [Halobacteriovorax marinus]CBW27013.1 putative DnaK suppressor family protein [Halobacteriovorax marinus SJ]
MKRENSYLSDKQIEKLKDTLLAEKERIYNKSQNSENYCLDKNELSDPVDEASVNVQTSQEIRFRNRDIFYLKKINKALTKIEEGTYGLCQECDDEINFERLMARTTAELCIGCKEEAEFSEKNNFIQRKSKSLGKTLSELSSK